MSSVKAVDDISFDIAPGTAVGLIGLNGAGKSTLQKMITGVLVPTSGSLKVTGLNPEKSRKNLAKKVGVVFGHRTQLWWDVPLVDSLNVLRRVYGVDKSEFEARKSKLADLLDLGDLMPRAPRQFSLGQRVRAEIMASLLHGPQLLVLDEPTVGLDVLAKANIRTLIRSLVEEEGVSVLLASHEVADIEEICSRALLIDHGKLLFDGSLEELTAKSSVDRTLSLEVVHEDSSSESGVRLETVSIDLDSTDAARQINEATQTGKISEASVGGGSLESVLAAMFAENADQRE